MNISFGKIKIHNFMSYENQEFDFSDNRGLVLVTGENKDIKDSKNGTGKSSLFSALLYALFGQLQYTIKNANLKNRYAKDNVMWVELEFFDDLRNRYVVKRELNKYGSTVLSVNKFDKEGNKENLTRFSIAETDNFLQKEILKCDISIFLRVIFLSSDQNYNFFKLTASAKRDFIEKLFDITAFGEIYSAMHKDLLKLDKEISKQQGNLVALNKNQENYETKLKAFKSEKAAKLSELAEKITEIKEQMVELQKNQVSTGSKNIKKLETAMNTLSKVILECESTEREVKKKKTLAESVQMRLNAKLKSCKDILDKHAEMLELLCSDCKPLVKKYYNLDKYSKDAEKAKVKMAEVSEKMAELQKAEKTVIKKRTNTEAKYEKCEQALETIKENIKNTESKIKHAEVELAGLEKMHASTESQVNPYEELITEVTSEIECKNKELAELEQTSNYLKFSENIVNADTLKKFIIKDLVLLLNNKIKHYLALLGGEFECIFDENMDSKFVTSGGECDYANFSSGEQMRLMIATCFAFKDFMQTRNNFSSNILILDEFIDSGIDDLAIDGVLRILEDFKDENNQSIYIISHRISMADSYNFDNAIKIVKQNNLSSVVYLSGKTFEN